MIASTLTALRRTSIGPRSVTAILKTFDRTVAELKHTETAKAAEAARLRAKADAAQIESTRAFGVRTKIETLIA